MPSAVERHPDSGLPINRGPEVKPGHHNVGQIDISPEAATRAASEAGTTFDGCTFQLRTVIDLAIEPVTIKGDCMKWDATAASVDVVSGSTVTDAAFDGYLAVDGIDEARTTVKHCYLGGGVNGYRMDVASTSSDGVSYLVDSTVRGGVWSTLTLAGRSVLGPAHDQDRDFKVKVLNVGEIAKTADPAGNYPFRSSGPVRLDGAVCKSLCVMSPVSGTVQTRRLVVHDDAVDREVQGGEVLTVSAPEGELLWLALHTPDVPYVRYSNPDLVARIGDTWWNGKKGLELARIERARAALAVENPPLAASNHAAYDACLEAGYITKSGKVRNREGYELVLLMSRNK